LTPFLFEHESYYALSNKWVYAKNLKTGDKVLLSSGEKGLGLEILITTTYQIHLTSTEDTTILEATGCLA